MVKSKKLTLFGGEEPWKPSEWTSSDDRVRGGASQSYLTITDSPNTARFHGTLDITTLGGAGFASQRTSTSTQSWDLSAYDGILLHLGKGDGKKYTFLLKDEVLPQDQTGREQSTTSWEYDFVAGGSGKEGEGLMGEEKWLFVPWGEFKATFRGKERKGEEWKLDRKGVRRFSVMMRSFFGDQEGDFSLTIKSIKAITTPEDLEKGNVEIDDQSRRQTFRVPTLMGVVALGVLAYGFCKYVCPLIHDMGGKSHWT